MAQRCTRWKTYFLIKYLIPIDFALLPFSALHALVIRIPTVLGVAGWAGPHIEMEERGARGLEALARVSRKKARIGREGRRLPSSSSLPMRALYFDTIPQEEILDNILRHLSPLPQAVKWDKYMQLKFLLGILRANGTLGAFVAGRFNELCISKTLDCAGEQNLYKWKAHDFVTNGGGASLETIMIGDDMYYEAINGRCMVGDFLRSCPNVRSLSVAEISGLWSSAFAMQLEKLEVSSSNTAIVFIKSGSALRELNLDCGYSFCEEGDIEWGGIGKKLERLMISGVSCSEDGLKTMREHCKNLKHVDLRIANAFSVEESRNMAEFISSYGDQLDTIHAYDMEVGDLKLVYEKCVNARFHVDVTRDSLSLPALRVLGPRMEKIRIFCEAFDFDREGFTAGWNLCSSLKEFGARKLYVEDISAFMATAKDNLRKISIYPSAYDEYGICNVEEIMNVIAKGTKSVEVLHIEQHIISLSSFDKFIDKNKSTLRSFSVINSADDLITQADVDKMVEKLLECPLLEDVSFAEEGATEKLLKTLRKRGIHFRSSD